MKKGILTVFLATAVAVSVSTTAFTVTAVSGYVGGFLDINSVEQTNYEYGTFLTSSVTVQRTEIPPLVEVIPRMTGEDDLIFVDVIKQGGTPHVTAPVGAVLSAAPAAGYQLAGSTYTTANRFAKNSGGTFAEERNSIPLRNGGTSYTISATLAKKPIAIQASVINSRGENPETFYVYSYVSPSVPASSPQVIGATQPTTTPVVAPAVTGTYKSDTDKHLNTRADGVCQFKTISLNDKQPAFNVAGNPSRVTFNSRCGSDYLYPIKAVGKTGQYSGVRINGEKTTGTIISIMK